MDTIITPMTEAARPDALLNGGTAALLKLQTWLSPTFPIGAFGYSHGLEVAIVSGRLRDAAGCAEWIETLVTLGSGWNDLVLLAEAHRAQRRADDDALRDVAELGIALSGSAERRQETVDLGTAFLSAASPWGAGTKVWPYPVAVGALAAREGVPLEMTCAAFAHGFAANLLSVAVRLVPLGQREAVAILHRMEPLLTETAIRAAASALDDLGSAAILSEIQAMRHETLTTRLFRT